MGVSVLGYAAACLPRGYRKLFGPQARYGLSYYNTFKTHAPCYTFICVLPFSTLIFDIIS